MTAKKPISAREAVDLVERRRETMRLANAAGRARDEASGLKLFQVKVPTDSAELLKQIAAALRGKSADRRAAADALAAYKPARARKQADLFRGAP